MTSTKLTWQSKLVLLAVLPFAAAQVVLQTRWWAVEVPEVAIWTVSLSLIFGIIVFSLRAATASAAITGAIITASLMYSTAIYPYRPWHTALMPGLAVFLLAYVATRMGRAEKEELGSAESRTGRTAAQVAANLGVAALGCDSLAQSWLVNSGCFPAGGTVLFATALAALAEAAADTVSSEVGQVLGGGPWLVTTLRRVDPGTDGAISPTGTLAGFAAAAIVAAAGTLALRGGPQLFWISLAGGVFGFTFDSLLGATLERRGWLNNDAVNFLSTASATGFALALLAVLPHPAAALLSR